VFKEFENVIGEESGSDLMSSYETLSEESGSSDSDDEDKQSVISEGKFAELKLCRFGN
jgi:hypothetical protein